MAAPETDKHVNFYTPVRTLAGKELTDVKLNINQTCMTGAEILHIYWTASDTNDNLEAAVTCKKNIPF